MKVLIVGGGGREHALAWRLAQSDSVKTVLAVPGNPGIARVGRCLPVPATIPAYVDLAEAEQVDYTVVGPEATLVDGIVDVFRGRGLKIVGPTAMAARLEGSKIFAKQFFQRAGIPTARAASVSSQQEALDNLKYFSFPAVVKADGLAAGKGVIIAQNKEEAEQAVAQLGPHLVIEEFLEGEEVSFIAVSDGREILPFEATQDHKRVGDGDQGPNTGGMGAYCDGRILTEDQTDIIIDQVMRPAIAQMSREGTPFTGFLYAGLMMTADGPKALEFNVRLGDPETQALMHRLDCDLGEVLHLAAQSQLDAAQLRWKKDPSVCVVVAAAGYPEKVRTDDVITGIADAEALGATVFHAGTRQINGSLVASGGRVLGVTASGPDLAAAIRNTYQAVEKISLPGGHYRKDIAQKGLKRW